MTRFRPELDHLLAAAVRSRLEQHGLTLTSFLAGLTVAERIQLNDMLATLVEVDRPFAQAFARVFGAPLPMRGDGGE